MLPNGLRLYSFQYRRDPTTTYVGVLAQDLLKSENSKFRNAVVVGSNGYYAVKYDELGLKMLTLDEWRSMSWRFASARAALAQGNHASATPILFGLTLHSRRFGVLHLDPMPGAPRSVRRTDPL